MKFDTHTHTLTHTIFGSYSNADTMFSGVNSIIIAMPFTHVHH